MAQENKFIRLYAKFSATTSYPSDSSTFYADKFEKDFPAFLKKNPETINYPFKKLTAKTGCDVITSSDGNFRIYSWDTWQGGTMHVFRSVYQWKANGNVYTQVPTYEEGDAGTFCSAIFTVPINNQPYYLAVTNGIYSTKDSRQSISVFSVKGNQLNTSVRLFKTKTQQLNTIDVDFDFFSVVDRPERPLKLITYNEDRKIIRIPVVNDQGKVTKRTILYQLKGQSFEFTGIETGVRK